MKLSEMRRLLEDNGIQLTKSLGQNFLHDGNLLGRIVRTAALQPGERVLEIGPGLGPLTELILQHAANVLAIEKDGRLVEVLKQRFAGVTGLELRQADALRVVQDEPRDWSGWVVVSNLPYSVASPVLVSLAESDGPPERMIVTLQAEVVHRIAAKAGDKDYGLLSLLLQLRYSVGEHFKIPASCFFPPPEVESACIYLTRRSAPLLSRPEARIFTRIVKRGFSQRRKMMFKLLRAEWTEPDLAAGFEHVSIARTVRAEAVSLEQFVALTKFMAKTKTV